MFDDVLNQLGLEWSDLTEEEKQSLQKMRTAVKSNDLTVDDMREHVDKMIDSVSRQLSGVGESTWSILFNWRRRKHLRARLENYILLKDVLTRQEKMMEKQKQHVRQNLLTEKDTGGWF